MLVKLIVNNVILMYNVTLLVILLWVHIIQFNYIPIIIKLVLTCLKYLFCIILTCEYSCSIFKFNNIIVIIK